MAGTMRGEPLVMCPRHPGEEALWHRSNRRCPLCAALEQVEQLRQALQALTMRKEPVKK